MFFVRSLLASIFKLRFSFGPISRQRFAFAPLLLQSMSYCVYRLTYRTTWGAPRVYIGYTANQEWRRAWREVKANSWNKHRDMTKPAGWHVLESGLGSKPLALALEASHAACGAGFWFAALC